MTREEEINYIVAELDKVAPIGTQGRMLIAPLIRLAEIVKETKPAEPATDGYDRLDEIITLLGKTNELLDTIAARVR